MSWIFIIAAILIIAAIVLSKFSNQKPAETDSLQYQKLEVLFTAAERSFLGVLKLAVSDEVEVFGKVRVADVITPKKGQPRGVWQRSFNKISAKHFDFLLCKKEDLSPICAIELNDSSHNSKKRIERDQFLESACNSASLPLVQVTAKATYQVADIQHVLSDYMRPIGTHKTVEIKHHTSPSTADTGKQCPKCASFMAVKIAKKGKNIGNEFWACSAFPKCRYLEAKKA